MRVRILLLLRHRRLRECQRLPQIRAIFQFPDWEAIATVAWLLRVRRENCQTLMLLGKVEKAEIETLVEFASFAVGTAKLRRSQSARMTGPYNRQAAYMVLHRKFGDPHLKRA